MGGLIMCVLFFPQAVSCAAAFFCDFRDFCVTFKFAEGKKETLAAGKETTCRGQR